MADGQEDSSSLESSYTLKHSPLQSGPYNIFPLLSQQMQNNARHFKTSNFGANWRRRRS